MIYYFVVINVIAFFLYGYDKMIAIKGKRRISEYHLFVFAFFGGGIGALLGMKVFHHKTKKVGFWVLNILFTILWIIYLIGN